MNTNRSLFFNRPFTSCHIGTLRPGCNVNSILGITVKSLLALRLLIRRRLESTVLMAFGPVSAVLSEVADMSSIDTGNVPKGHSK